MQLGSLGCQYPGKDSSSGGGFEGYRASQHRTPCSSQVLEGSRELFTQYTPITLAPVAIAIAPLVDCELDTRKRRQNRSMPLPKISREDSESGSLQGGGSVVVTSADVERRDEKMLSNSTAFIFPSYGQRVGISAQLKIRRQRSKSL